MPILLAKHPYIKFQRKIDHWEMKQINYEENHEVYLYVDRVVTHEKAFAIREVLDLSYKMMSARYGFFYLHTTKGVFTLHVKEPPDKFIEEFRKVEIK